MLDHISEQARTVVGACHVAVHDWYHRLEHLVEPDRGRREAVAVDETKRDIEDQTVSVWAAVDGDTFDVRHIEVSPGRSSRDALLVLTDGLTYCRGQPAPSADRGGWDDWPRDLLECNGRGETWGDRSLIEAWIGLLTYRIIPFRHRVPHYSTRESTDNWLTVLPAPHTALRQR